MNKKSTMKNFPLFKTKSPKGSPSFVLDDPLERRQYFDFKADREIEKLRDYLRKNSFVCFLVGPKNSGKGTYSKLFAEAVGPRYTRHISVGDVVRDAHKLLGGKKKDKELLEFLKKNKLFEIKFEDIDEEFISFIEINIPNIEERHKVNTQL